MYVYVCECMYVCMCVRDIENESTGEKVKLQKNKKRKYRPIIYMYSKNFSSKDKSQLYYPVRDVCQFPRENEKNDINVDTTSNTRNFGCVLIRSGVMYLPNVYNTRDVASGQLDFR